MTCWPFIILALRMGWGQLKKSPCTVYEEENVSGKLAIAFIWELLLPLSSTFSSYASYLASWRNSLFQFFLLQADSSTAKTTLARLGSPFASFASTSSSTFSLYFVNTCQVKKMCPVRLTFSWLLVLLPLNSLKMR